MSFLKFKITIYGQELPFNFFFLNTASAPSTYLKTREANLSARNVIPYLCATRRRVRACRNGRPFRVGTRRVDSLLVLAHTS